MPTRYNMARQAVDEAIALSLNLREFELHLKSLGYRVQLNPRRKYWTVTPKGWEKPIQAYAARKRIYERTDHAETVCQSGKCPVQKLSKA